MPIKVLMPALSPTMTEGKADTKWVVLDYIDVMVHVMSDELREMRTDAAELARTRPRPREIFCFSSAVRPRARAAATKSCSFNCRISARTMRPDCGSRSNMLETFSVEAPAPGLA